MLLLLLLIQEPTGMESGVEQRETGRKLRRSRSGPRDLVPLARHRAQQRRIRGGRVRIRNADRDRR